MFDNYKEIPGYPSYYVNTNGDIMFNKKQCKSYKTKSGYLRCILPKSQNKKFISVHRAVALTFIPNPNNYNQVNHINGNKVANLD